MSFPKVVIASRKMTRSKWIIYNWVNVQTITDIEPMYLCTGLRDIAEAKEAADQYDTWSEYIDRETKGLDR